MCYFSLQVTVMRLRNIFLALLILGAFPHPIYAQETAGEAERTVESPSPDGRFAFLATRQPDGKKTFDLIKKNSGEVLLRVAESDADFGNRLTTAVLWTRDSKRFALNYSLVRLGEEVSVFFRRGGAFRELKLPKLPEARLPKLSASQRKHLWHISANNSTGAVRWQKHGSLVVEIESSIDGNSSFAKATRTVVLAFNRFGAVRIIKSAQEVNVHIEPKDPVLE